MARQLQPLGRAKLTRIRWGASARFLLVVSISASLLIGGIVIMLGPVTSWIGGQTVAAITPAEDRAAALNEVRQTFLAALAGVGATLGLVFTGRAYLLSRRTHFSDRFQEAIALLAGDNSTARLGGVYALENLMRESLEEHEAIVDVLTDFVRTSASRASDRQETGLEPTRATRLNYYSIPHPPADIQAALLVIGRRPTREERKPLDFANTNLVGAYLAGGRFDGAYFTASRMTSAYATDASFVGAIFASADLRGINLRLARLDRSDFRGAEMREALLSDAHICGAKLDQVTGLELEQLNEAVIDSSTQLPRGWAKALKGARKDDQKRSS